MDPISARVAARFAAERRRVASGTFGGPVNNLNPGVEEGEPLHDGAGRPQKYMSIGGDLEASYDGRKYVDIRDKSFKERRVLIDAPSLISALLLTYGLEFPLV